MTLTPLPQNPYTCTVFGRNWFSPVTPPSFRPDQLLRASFSLKHPVFSARQNSPEEKIWFWSPFTHLCQYECNFVGAEGCTAALRDRNNIRTSDMKNPARMPESGHNLVSGSKDVRQVIERYCSWLRGSMASDQTVLFIVQGPLEPKVICSSFSRHVSRRRKGL